MTLALPALTLAAADGCRPRGATTTPASPPATGTPWFQDVTERWGLDFVHDPGPVHPPTYFMPQITGSGAALFDFDGDGLLDIYLVQNGGPQGRPNKLYRQRPGGRFEDVTARSGLGVAGWGMGVAVGDVNNDGRPDLLLTGYGGVRLFLNNGDGTFTDVTKEAGLDNPHWATAAAFFDYDRDGRLDLVIVNYVDYDPSRRCLDGADRPDYCHPKTFTGTVTKLFRNLGPGARPGRVRFQDVTVAAGLAAVQSNGLGVLCADFDGDGWPDIFVASDSEPNRLWVNRHDGTFAEEALQRGLAYNAASLSQANMGVAFADAEGKGLFDVFVTHLGEEDHTLWRQESGGLFQDQTTRSGLARRAGHGTGFGTVFGDFDNDGRPDLAIVNGRIRRGRPVGEVAGAPFWAPYGERNQLFANEGGGRFRDVSAANDAFCGTAAVWRGLAVGDLDNDGGLDLLATAAGAPARLYRNVSSARGHWLLVRALDPALHRDAYGATVALRVAGHRRLGWVNPGSSYLCSNDPRVHFGLGSADRYEGVEVLWPDGAREVFPGGAADHLLVLRKGEGRPAGR